MPGTHETLGKHDLVAAGLKAIDDVLGAAGARRGGRGGMGDRTATPAPATGVPVDSGSRRRGIRIAAGDDLRVQRTRPVVEATARVARDRIRLGEWVIPKHHAVIASITMAHQSEQNFPDAKTFNPDRFLGGNPDTHTWIPFGGGISGANSNSAPGLPRASGVTAEVSPPRPDVAAGPLSGLRV